MGLALFIPNFFLLKLYKATIPAILTCVYLQGFPVTPETAEIIYKPVGDNVVLHQGSVDSPSSIVWKYEDDLAVDMIRGVPEYYRQFKDRCDLNVSTGALTLRNITSDLKGYYSVWINDTLNKTILLQVYSETIYKAVGDNVVLRPGSVDSPSSVLWEHDDKLAVDMRGGETEYYRQFIDHCDLDVSTGALTLRNITSDLSGYYSVWIDGKLIKTIHLHVFNERIYKAGGDSVVLHPGSVDSLSSILWEHDGDLAVNMSGGKTEYYHQFKDRCDLDVNTGALTLRNITSDLSGSYYVWINNILIKTILLHVFTETIYKEMRDSVVLSPDSVDSPSYIRWEHDGDLVVYMRGGKTEYHCQFKDRCELDVSTGALTLKDLTSDLSGYDSVWINGKASKTILLHVFNEIIYRAGGHTVVLHVGSVDSPSSVLWEHDGDLAVNMSGGEIECYHQFIDRCDLDVSTGALTLKILTSDLSGNYSVLINGKLIKTILLQVFTERIYKAVGDSVVLSPDSVDSPSSVRWEHDGDWAVDMREGKTEYYDQFKDHSDLDNITGALTLRNLTLDLNGFYSVRINGKHIKIILLHVFSMSETIYKAVGDSVVLSPGSVDSPWSIVWRHDGAWAVEMRGGKTEYYKQFKDRSNLNVSTGALTLRNITSDLSGNYSIQINGKHIKTIPLHVDKGDKRLLWPLLILPVLLVVAVVVWWCKCRERQRPRMQRRGYGPENEVNQAINYGSLIVDEE